MTFQLEIYLQVIVFGFPMFTGDCVEFLSWFLNALHLALNGTKKLSSSIMSKTFRGKMRVYSRKVVPDGIVRTCEFTHIACILIQLHVQNSFAKRIVLQVTSNVVLQLLLSELNCVYITCAE